MARKPLAELYEYLHHPADYREAAVVAAIDELSRRNEILPPETPLLRTRLQVEAQRLQAEAEARQAAQDAARRPDDAPVSPWGNPFGADDSADATDDEPGRFRPTYQPPRPANRAAKAGADDLEADEADANAPTLYSPAVIFLFTTLISFVAGGVLLILNLLRVRQRTAAGLVAGFCLGYLLIVAALSQQMGRLGGLLNVPAALVFLFWFWPRYIGGGRAFKSRAFIWPLLICLGVAGAGVYALVKNGMMENPLDQFRREKARIEGQKAVPETGAGTKTALLTNSEAVRATVLAADRAFSARAAAVGLPRALREFAADSAVLLRPGARPVVGTTAIAAFAGSADSAFTLTWAPQAAIVAASGELAYTYGTYQRQPKATGAPVSGGTYVTVWHRDGRTGAWRYALDAGIEGLPQ